MRPLIAFFILCFLPLSAAFSATASFTITGVSGKALSNVEKRLEEVQQAKSLSSMTADELRTHVIQALEPFGYLKAQVAVRIINDQKAIIQINPGPLTYISSLQVQLTGEGMHNAVLQKTVHDIPLHSGTPLLMPEYNKAKLSISNSAENLGYLHGTYKKTEILISENNTAAITLIFDTGPLFYFGQAQFNPSNISPQLLHRFVPFHVGQTYSSDQVLKLNNDLSGSSSIIQR